MEPRRREGKKEERLLIVTHDEERVLCDGERARS